MRAAPRYTHDCASCIFMGVILMPNSSEAVDAYVCPARGLGKDGSVILRHSSEGSDYWSSPVAFIEQMTGEMQIAGDEAQLYAYSGTALIANWVLSEAIKRGHIKAA